MPELEPSECAASIGDLLDRHGIRWVLAGALAALRYRTTPRLTTDADLLVERAPTLIDVLEQAGYRVRQVAEPGEPPHLLLVDGRGARVDMLLPIVDYQWLALERGLAQRCLTAEDVVIHKLIAWRPRDRNDIASILDSGVLLDRLYVEGWAREWDVLDRWQEAVARA